jgi:peptide/nickel transport system permease protein
MRPVVATAGAGRLVAGVSVLGQRLRRLGRALRSSPTALAGVVLVAPFVIGGVIGLVLLAAPSLKGTWTNQDYEATLARPITHGHLLGTDELGRDLLWRILVGMGVSLAIGVSITVLSLLIGLGVGLAAGYFGGWFDTISRGAIDLAWSFPVILLAVLFSGIIHPGAITIVISVALVSWAAIARVVRGYALSLRQREFVQAARARGLPAHRIIRRHLLPNVIPAALVLTAYYLAVVIIVEAGISYLGLGVQPPTPSLGQMLADGRNYMRLDSWLVILPGVILAVATLGFNLLGDGLRDLLDPRLARPQA